MSDGFLAAWVASLAEGYTLTADDVRRLQRVQQALQNGVKHHEQARAAAGSLGIGSVNGKTVFTRVEDEDVAHSLESAAAAVARLVGKLRLPDISKEGNA